MLRTFLAPLTAAAMLLSSHAAFAQARSPAFPIVADDGRPILNHRVKPDQATAVEKLPGAVILGNPKGDVTLAEFYDVNCPYCRRASNDVDSLLRQDRNLRLVLVPFPVLGLQSVLAGRVELAVRRLATPAQFYEFHRRLFAGRGTIDGERALEAAQALKFEREKLIEIANDDATTEIMKTHVRLGNALDLAATPSYVIGDVAILGHPGAESLKRVVASMRQCGKAVC
ncbi:MAG: DsbA family protein [Pseudorhodoplanes sp.]|nr:DsbA family protein [Pseudorhodoplanes sp.]